MLKCSSQAMVSIGGSTSNLSGIACLCYYLPRTRVHLCRGPWDHARHNSISSLFILHTEPQSLARRTVQYGYGYACCLLALCHGKGEGAPIIRKSNSTRNKHWWQWCLITVLITIINASVQAKGKASKHVKLKQPNLTVINQVFILIPRIAKMLQPLLTNHVELKEPNHQDHNTYFDCNKYLARAGPRAATHYHPQYTVCTVTAVLVYRLCSSTVHVGCTSTGRLYR